MLAARETAEWLLSGTLPRRPNDRYGRKSVVSDSAGQKFPNDLSAHQIHGRCATSYIGRSRSRLAIAG